MAGVLYVVGIGPGEEAQMTPQADEAVRQSQVLAGYTVYVDLLRERYPDIGSTLCGFDAQMAPSG